MVGRGVNVQVHVRNRLVSRRHARLVRRGSGYAVIDLKTPNGVLVDGRRVKRELELGDGDVLQLGSSVLRFQAARGEGLHQRRRGRVPLSRPLRPRGSGDLRWRTARSSRSRPAWRWEESLVCWALSGVGLSPASAPAPGALNQQRHQVFWCLKKLVKCTKRPRAGSHRR